MIEVQSLVDEFRRELPWHLRCTLKVAETSAYAVRFFLRNQQEPFPVCFDYPHIMKWLQYLQQTPPHHRHKAHREASTINSHLKALRRFAKWAIARGFIESDPTATIKTLPEQDRTILAPDDSIIRKVLEVTATHGSTPELRKRNQAMLALMVDCGPRAMEVAAIDIDDVLEKDGTFREAIVLHGKGSRDRFVSLNPGVAEVLAEYLPYRRPAPGIKALLLTEAGRRLTYAAIRGVVQRISRRAGVIISPHDFRRYSLTALYLAGVNQSSGMALSGHKRIDVYEKYIRGGLALRAVVEHRRLSPLGALQADAVEIARVAQ